MVREEVKAKGAKEVKEYITRLGPRQEEVSHGRQEEVSHGRQEEVNHGCQEEVRIPKERAKGRTVKVRANPSSEHVGAAASRAIARPIAPQTGHDNCRVWSLQLPQNRHQTYKLSTPQSRRRSGVRPAGTPTTPGIWDTDWNAWYLKEF